MPGKKIYTVGILARGRGYRTIKVRASSKAEVRKDAKKWLESGSKFGVFANAKEKADWESSHSL